MVEFIMDGLSNALSPVGIGLIFLGVTLGMFGGALPGISASVSIALILPLTFTLDPASALILLGAIYMAAEFGGSISAVLLNTPGTPAAICTAMDGFPLAGKGRAREAISIAVIGSAIGGLFGAAVLLFFTPTLARWSLAFGAPETFWLAIAGLATVCTLTAQSFAKGMAMASLGLWMSTVGIDPTSGYSRFTFGTYQLESGISLIPAILGFFAMAQMLNLIGQGKEHVAELPRQPGAVGKAFARAVARPFLILRSSIIGVLIGILPGAGASIASFIAYGEAKRSSSEPETFGEGNPDGIYAAESANNAMVGGSLVPLLALGIPGSASAAILYGSLTINGIIPGPRLFIEHGDVAYRFIVALFPICLAMLLTGLVLMPLYSLILRIRVVHIVPAVFALTIVGAFSVRNNAFDIYVAFACGLLGFILLRLRYAIAPLILGLVLGPLVEESYTRSASLARVDGSLLAYFFGRPLSIVLISITVIIVLSAFWAPMIKPWLNRQRQGKQVK